MSEGSLVAATFAVALGGGLLPFVNVELYLVAVALAQPHTAALPLVVAAALGQTVAKMVLYGVGLGALRLPFFTGANGEKTRTRLARSAFGPRTVVFASALLGVPPFYAVSVAAGALRLGLLPFTLLGLAGRLLRFAAVLVAPRLWP